MNAAARQIATADVARPILDAGLGDQLQELVFRIAANAANPIADAAEMSHERNSCAERQST